MNRKKSPDDLTPFFRAVKGADKTHPVHLLLGNGFSSDLDSAFRYDKLVLIMLEYLKAKDDESHKRIARLLSELDVTDIEELINGLAQAARITQIYQSSPDARILTYMTKDSHNLRSVFAHSIARKHPDRRMQHSNSSYLVCADNLARFSSVFTLNYDLLLQWTTESQGTSIREGKWNDGFRFFPGSRRAYRKHYKADVLPYTRTGMPPSQHLIRLDRGYGQNVFYLHGALHFFNQSGHLTKLLGTKDDNELLFFDVVSQIIEEDDFPNIVIEGSHELKLKEIRKDMYLSSCYDALSCLAGSLFVFGCALYQHDGHIRDAIARSDVSDLYFGYRGFRRRPSERKIVEGPIEGIAEGREEYRVAGGSKPPLRVHFCETGHVERDSFWRSGV